MKNQAGAILMAYEPWAQAFAIQRQTVQRFHQTCAAVLGGSCSLNPLQPEQLSLQRNLFSTLFIMATKAAGVALDVLPLYAMINQCLRVQVTGCDNLLDDEYKSVIPFSLSGSGTRFRSVLTIMTGDTVLANLILEEVASGRMNLVNAQQLLAASLAVLIPSGIEEHEEESSIKEPVPPVEIILQQVHPRKTGLLFEAPIRLVGKMQIADLSRSQHISEALSKFGVGCQILDDLKDVADDLYHRKYNIVISQAWHGNNEAEKQQIAAFLQSDETYEQAQDIAARLTTAHQQDSLNYAGQYFHQAAQIFCQYFPDFKTLQASALGSLVQNSIMSERNTTEIRVMP
ncbi:class 1 isoprenoid biosynthesis enzyme [uncultured Desulfuromusa sp.]|uniref:class 1 isoprenoid biosynthesis enzyme n=1 Tax=uncultured Desulfuromusa sp. TaxID=219183 RepID=UPI002AA82047|nr:class 1 isoprenoid biosynthesis enzyme [uncultured Desulfuromusa sp.]